MNPIHSNRVRAIAILLGWTVSTVFSQSLMAVDCTSMNIELNSQEQVDGFQQNHGPCDVVAGSLTVVGNDIGNLDGLSELSAVNGSFFLSDNPALTSLQGLKLLAEVGKDFTIQANDALEELRGLSSLRSVGDNFYIFRNGGLLNLRGLESLMSVGNRFWIQGNPKLTNVDALGAFGDLGGSLRVYANDKLTNLDGFSGLERIHWALEIIDNDSLADVDGFSNLHTVEGWMLIEFNDALVSVKGLSRLSVIESFSIRQNSLLTNLDGLEAVTRVGSLSVTWNKRLSDCLGIIKLIDPIDDYEQNHEHSLPHAPDVGSYLTLNNNLRGCNSVNEILSTAQLGSLNAGINDAWFYPETDGQGFLVTVFPEIKQVFVAWFTFDNERPPDDVTAILGEPGHRWLTAHGDFEENIAELTLHITTGGLFDSGEPAPGTEPYGEFMLEFSTCNAGIVTYDIPSVHKQGEVAIERIALDNVPLCYVLNGQALNKNPARD